ncbi:MAG: coproporphyrinogen dehydrogenase HemZ [Eubacterium sp.]|nr:coproporphyrinogen dehydrogenase HemZ [Eubacterium sp.]
MIRFEIKKNQKGTGEFSYDLKALALSFFPEEECQVTERSDWQGRSDYPLRMEKNQEVWLDTCLDENYSKNQVKAQVYEVLVKKAGRDLPWGILTGIRPAKIALRLLWDGCSYEEVLDHLQEEYLTRPAKAKLAADVAVRENELVGALDHQNLYNIYIGIPFCPSICGYCSFSAFPYKAFRHKVSGYLDALEKELAYTAKAFAHKKLHTVYVGGGTPTSLNEEELARLMDMIARHLPLSEVAEYTVEAGRPDSISRDKLEIMKKAGVGRISINPQTMKQETLDLMGRKHTVNQVKEVFAQARELGFDNINMDLIVGLPEEDEKDFHRTLQEVADLNPDSVTVHTLVIKRASRMRRDQLESGGPMREEDLLIPAMQDLGNDFLRGLGYEPYYMYRQKNKAGTSRNTNQENVAYARPGKDCLYNILIMEELETIVALGSGGSTKIVYPGENRMERVENVKNVDDYIYRIDEMIERKRNAFE